MVMNNDGLKPGTPTQARQLAESDDIASSLVLDTMLGFTTHKMAARFRPLKVDQEVVRKALERYAKDGDIEQAYNEIVFNAGDWERCYFITKSKPQIAAFKEHVSLSLFHSLTALSTSNLALFATYFKKIMALLGSKICPEQAFRFRSCQRVFVIVFTTSFAYNFCVFLIYASGGFITSAF